MRIPPPAPAPAPAPVVPTYADDSIRSLVPALLGPEPPVWARAAGVRGDDAIVLLVVDGLGAAQLAERAELAPTLHAGTDTGPAMSVAPSTTAAALTSISTGLTPGEHGVVGYRMRLGGDVINSLRWSTGRAEALRTHPPDEVQPFRPFLGADVTVCTRNEFRGTGFTEAHLRGARWRGWSQPSNLPVEVAAAVAGGARFVYAYYDGIDHVAHEFGFGAHYDAELGAADRLLADLLDRLPAGVSVIVTADHGQVDVRGGTIELDRAIAARCTGMSGEGRFRWLHVKPGQTETVAELAEQRYGDVAWVISRDDAVAAGWFGPTVSAPVRARFGEVALVPFAPVTFDDPLERNAVEMICRHGSLTPAEMLVPRIVIRT